MGDGELEDLLVGLDETLHEIGPLAYRRRAGEEAES